jgi:hypothetical protein
VKLEEVTHTALKTLFLEHFFVTGEKGVVKL